MPSLGPIATATFSRHTRHYGTRRLRAELRAQGHAVGRYALLPWLLRRGLRALSSCPQRPRTTAANLAAVVVEDLLLSQPVSTIPNQMWVILATCPWSVDAGVAWPPSATCSRRVVGWHFNAQMPAELVLTALQRVLTLREPVSDPVIHADCGSQYTSAVC